MADDALRRDSNRGWIWIPASLLALGLGAVAMLAGSNWIRESLIAGRIDLVRAVGEVQTRTSIAVAAPALSVFTRTALVRHDVPRSKDVWNQRSGLGPVRGSVQATYTLASEQQMDGWLVKKDSGGSLSICWSLAGSIGGKLTYVKPSVWVAMPLLLLLLPPSCGPDGWMDGWMDGWILTSNEMPTLRTTSFYMYH